MTPRPMLLRAALAAFVAAAAGTAAAPATKAVRAARNSMGRGVMGCS